jgi:hypothetical protein
MESDPLAFLACPFRLLCVASGLTALIATSIIFILT